MQGKLVMNHEQYGYGMEERMGSVDDDGDFVYMACMERGRFLHGW